MRAELAAFVIVSRVYLSCDLGTVCLTEWGDGQVTMRLLDKGEPNG
jgi:hypothetical protein